MSNTLIRSLCAVLFGIAAIPGIADAQSSAYTNSAAELYAGPAPDYPVVAQIPPGTALDVFGCLSDYTWCDVALPGVRGWIDAEQLDYPYQGNYVPLLQYGAIIGVPITGFAIGAYWDRYYRNRPWFHDRDRWEHRPEPRVGPGGIAAGTGAPAAGPDPCTHRAVRRPYSMMHGRRPRAAAGTARTAHRTDAGCRRMRVRQPAADCAECRAADDEGAAGHPGRRQVCTPARRRTAAETTVAVEAAVVAGAATNSVIDWPPPAPRPRLAGRKAAPGGGFLIRQAGRSHDPPSCISRRAATGRARRPCRPT
nr:SH3 domain-containing protein [Burkholderia sp. WTPI3]